MSLSITRGGKPETNGYLHVGIGTRWNAFCGPTLVHKGRANGPRVILDLGPFLDPTRAHTRLDELWAQREVNTVPEFLRGWGQS